MKRFMVIMFVLALLLMGCDSGTTVSESTGVDDGSAEAVNDAAAEAEDDAPGVVESTFSNLKDAMAASVPMKCTWSFSDANGELEGEMIVSGKKFKSESSFKGDGQSFTTNSISDGTYMYVWSDMPGAKAMKMHVPDDQDMDMPEEGSDQFMDFEADYNYKCRPTTVGPTTFSPPNMEFMDMSAMMENMQAFGQGGDFDMEEMEALAAQYE